MPRLSVASPVTAGFTSKLVPVAAFTAPSVWRAAPSIMGRLLYVVVVSPQDVLFIFVTEPPLTLPLSLL